MPELDIDLNDLGAGGLNVDLPAYQLPPEIWTLAHNIRYEEGIPTRLKGQSSVFGAPPVSPHFMLPISSTAQMWWLYMSLTKGYVYDGTTHTDITRLVGGDYITPHTRDWNATILGGIPIINNGADVPQFWASYSAGTKFAALTNWPGVNRAKIIRAFGPYLVAFNVTKTAVVYPHLVSWSHPAVPGAVPSSWDPTDVTKDTGENDLPDVESGIIMNAVLLKGNMFVYKERSTWLMRYIGGRLVFAFDNVFGTTGTISPRGVGIIDKRAAHAVWTQNDIIVHTGVEPVSILTRRLRRALFSELDPQNFLNSFVFIWPQRNEAWFCYPTVGATNPDKALIWNYEDNSFGQFSSGDVNFRNVALGAVESSDTLTWEAIDDTWEADNVKWSDSARDVMVASVTDATRFDILDSTDLREGVDFDATLQRTGLSLIGRKRSGDWIVDFKRYKMVRRLWPKVIGGPVDIRMGGQIVPDGPVTWGPKKSFDPATQHYLDFEVTGRAIAIEISTPATTGIAWKFNGYKIELVVQGNF